MSFSISTWLHSYQAPAVLMIDDLNDVYIEHYNEPHKNDWGYLCDEENSAYTFLKNNLLNKFPEIKITFFVPYKRHNVVNPNHPNSKKFAVGERSEFSTFLKKLLNEGHEIAHHGSDHGEYIDIQNLSTYNNFKHEWELYESVDEGVETTLKGKEVFKIELNTDVTGGKFCGYKMRENSLEIIDKSNLEYWCIDAKLDPNDSNTYFFGENNVIAFPTSFNGNSFVRLKYKTGKWKRDLVKLFTQFLQPLYNKTQYKNLDSIYEMGNIISIQEHISPVTSSGSIQASNIVSDIHSLNKIFTYLAKKSIWHASCKNISRYIYVRTNSSLEVSNNTLSIHFNNYKNLDENYLTVENPQPFTLQDENSNIFKSKFRNNQYFISLKLQSNVNHYTIK